MLVKRDLVSSGASRPVRYGIFARFADWHNGRRDGRAGFPIIDSDEGTVGSTPTFEALYLQALNGFHRIWLVADADLAESRAQLTLARAAFDVAVSVLERTEDSVVGLLDHNSLSVPRYGSGEANADPPIVIARRSRELERRMAAAETELRSARQDVDSASARVAGLVAAINARIAWAQVDGVIIHDHYMRRFAVYTSALVRHHLHGGQVADAFGRRIVLPINERKPIDYSVPHIAEHVRPAVTARRIAIARGRGSAPSGRPSASGPQDVLADSMKTAAFVEVARLLHNLSDAVDEGTPGVLDNLIDAWRTSWIATADAELSDRLGSLSQQIAVVESRIAELRRRQAVCDETLAAIRDRMAIAADRRTRFLPFSSHRRLMRAHARLVRLSERLVQERFREDETLTVRKHERKREEEGSEQTRNGYVAFAAELKAHARVAIAAHVADPAATDTIFRQLDRVEHRRSSGPSVVNVGIEGRRAVNGWLDERSLPLRVGLPATVWFTIGEGTSHSDVDNPYAPEHGLIDVRGGSIVILLLADQADIYPAAQTVTLHPIETLEPLTFTVTPRDAGPLRLRFQIYSRESSVLLQELESAPQQVYESFVESLT